jgi:hypothetical protein
MVVGLDEYILADYAPDAPHAFVASFPEAEQYGIHFAVEALSSAEFVVFESRGRVSPDNFDFNCSKSDAVLDSCFITRRCVTGSPDDGGQGDSKREAPGYPRG